MTTLTLTKEQKQISTNAAKGRPAMQFDSEIEATLRACYDGSAALVRRLAEQYGVADSTIRGWARRLGLTRRSRPRPQSGKNDHHPWKITLQVLDEEKEPVVTADKDTVTVNLVRAYLKEMGQYPRLTSQQEQLLGERIACGDQEAKHDLILANLRLVVRIARHYAAKANPTLDLLDLIQEGTLGLIHAADIFDVERGWHFSTLATWWIRQAVSRAMMEQGRTIRLPVGAQEQIQDLQHLLLDADEDLSVDTLAERLQLRRERVQELLTASQEIYSLDIPSFGSEGDLELGQALEAAVPSPEDHAVAGDLRGQLINLLQELQPRDRQVIELRYGLDGEGERTLEEVGKLLGVTRERIRQIEIRVLGELQQEAKVRHLQDYLSV